MKQKTTEILWAAAMTLLILTVLSFALRPAYATNKPPPVEQEQDQHQKQSQANQQDVTVNIGGGEGEGALSSLSTGATTLEGGDTTFNSTNESSNVVLVPNNNTENCLRIWGISFGTSSGSGGIGYPHRSAACDYEQAADDAGAVGDHSLAWYWRCHKRNIYKPFKGKGVSKEQATEACHAKMTQFIDIGTLAERNAELERRVALLLEERAFDRDTCEESKDRIIAGCMEK